MTRFADGESDSPTPWHPRSITPPLAVPASPYLLDMIVLSSFPLLHSLIHSPTLRLFCLSRFSSCNRFAIGPCTARCIIEFSIAVIAHTLREDTHTLRTETCREKGGSVTNSWRRKIPRATNDASFSLAQVQVLLHVSFILCYVLSHGKEFDWINEMFDELLNLNNYISSGYPEISLT